MSECTGSASASVGEGREEEQEGRWNKKNTTKTLANGQESRTSCPSLLAFPISRRAERELQPIPPGRQLKGGRNRSTTLFAYLVSNDSGSSKPDEKGWAGEGRRGRPGGWLAARLCYPLGGTRCISCVTSLISPGEVSLKSTQAHAHSHITYTHTQDLVLVRCEPGRLERSKCAAQSTNGKGGAGVERAGLPQPSLGGKSVSGWVP